ncbi:hypothetical protein PHYPSEUDO_010607 [Phytophthora pseudosyringae]|uniref:Uncharacterized protein n=1 Tax=Phytophthora pseudosyringae TaxID=221518 RepID=A0A8T1VAR3_9STRA|nr:hypothetical protein PHYPSEUDO_010607 [Phytophthora pseudosyringae]
MKEPWHPNLKRAAAAAQAPARLEKGCWYSWRVRANHFAGTYWDNDAAELYKGLFARVALEYEQDDVPKRFSNGHEHHQTHRQNARATWRFRRSQSQESLRSE